VANRCFALILVTGASGFIGRTVCNSFRAFGYDVAAAVRSGVHGVAFTDGVSTVNVGPISSDTPWGSALRGIEAVVHCAARAHLSSSRRESYVDYRSVNVDGTAQLALQAAEAGVKRFIFLSSIGVNGRSTDSIAQCVDSVPAFTHLDLAAPEEPYARSKWEAEQILWDISSNTGLEIVVIRAPLVYGRGVRGNFARLCRMVRSGFPLPFGAVENSRSFVGLDNLVSLIMLCVRHPSASGQTFLVSDGEDLSTPQLLRLVAAAMGRSANLIAVPVPLLRFVGTAVGRRTDVDRMVGSLRIDSSHTRQVLDWAPTVSVQEGIRRMVQGT
jgi:nucleoside-diphosphate-sugar epimerase